MNLNSPDNIANALSQITWLTGNPADVNTIYQLYNQVTPQDVQEAVRRYLVPQKLTIGTIAPAPESPFKS
jgi:zinc protease